MQTDKNISGVGPLIRSSSFLTTIGIVGLIAVYGLVRNDMIVGAEYLSARVIATQTVAGENAHNRLVIVDLGGYQRALRTSDWMLRTDPGRLICVKRSTFLLRRFKRHSLVLPGYCPALRQMPVSRPLAVGPLAE